MSHLTTTPALTPKQAALFDRIEATPKRPRRCAAPLWTPIHSADALLEANLEGEDLDEAFAALTEPQKTKFVDDPRRTAHLPAECFFV